MHSTANESHAQGAVLQAALEYRERGWSVIATQPNSKIAAVPWKQWQTQIPGEDQVRQWYNANSRFGVAVVLGRVSGDLLCRDFDEMDAYRLWSAAHPSLASTLPTVATSRGRHVYFRGNWPAATKLADGELHSNGAYCLAPPSIHPSGLAYSWINPLGKEPLPFIEDLRAAGLAPSPDTQRPQPAQDHPEHTRSAGVTVGTVSSADAVYSVFHGVDGAVTRAIHESLPTGPGTRHRHVFELARALKSIPELANTNVDDFKEIVEKWHSAALPFILTQDFVETWIDFLKAWPRVRVPKGATMAALMQEALRDAPPRVSYEYDNEQIRHLIALCRRLQKRSHDRPFFLSCRLAGGLLGVSHVQANRWLFLLCHDQVLKQLNQGDRGKRKAAEYYYLGGD